MGLSVLIDGKPATIESSEIDSFIGSSGLFRCWNSAPYDVVQLGNYSDSPTPPIYTVNSIPSFVWDKSTPLPIPGGGRVYMIQEEKFTESRGSDFVNWLVYTVLWVSFDGQYELYSTLESDRQFWGGFVKGAVKWAAVTAGVVYGAGLASASVGGAGTASAAASDWAVATAGMAEGMGTAAASDWAIATAGMAEGMGTAIATPVTVASVGATGATTGGTAAVSTATKAFSEVVGNVKSVAAAVVATRSAIDTIKAADSAPVTPPQNQYPTSSNNTMMLAGVAVLALLAIGS